MGRKSKIISGPVEAIVEVKEDKQDKIFAAVAPVPAMTMENAFQWTFVGAGTIGPMIDGKRVVIRFLPENGYMYTTKSKAVAEWLKEHGYKAA